jgi:hypothetical protein
MAELLDPFGRRVSRPIWKTAELWSTPRPSPIIESPRTTKLYDRTREELSAEEIGRIKI